MNAYQIYENDFESVISYNKNYAIIEFRKKTSGWGFLMNKKLMRIIEACNTKISLYYVDVDISPYLSEKFNVKKIPKYLLYKKQKIVCTFDGLMSEQELKEIFNKIYECKL